MRDQRIDSMRFIGLAMIILAHVDPPPILFQLRNFDVPLMVLVAGVSFNASYDPSTHYWRYLWRRVRRLVFPAWIFLSCYLSLFLCLGPGPHALTIKTVVTSYTFLSGIGYVWIVRVFLLVAIVAPLVYGLSRRTRSNYRYVLILAIVLVLYDLARHLSLPLITNDAGETVSLLTHYLVPYSVVFAIGVRMRLLTRRQVLGMAGICLGLFACFALGLYLVHGSIRSPQSFKYPPSLYYLSYGLFAASILHLCSGAITRCIALVKGAGFVSFVARNSMWVYLWHIPMAKHLQMSWAPKYAVTFALATGITYCQVWIVENLVVNHLPSERGKRAIRSVFTG